MAAAGTLWAGVDFSHSEQMALPRACQARRATGAARSPPCTELPSLPVRTGHGVLPPHDCARPRHAADGRGKGTFPGRLRKGSSDAAAPTPSVHSGEAPVPNHLEDPAGASDNTRPSIFQVPILGKLKFHGLIHLIVPNMRHGCHGNRRGPQRQGPAVRPPCRKLWRMTLAARPWRRPRGAKGTFMPQTRPRGSNLIGLRGGLGFGIFTAAQITVMCSLDERPGLKSRRRPQGPSVGPRDSVQSYSPGGP